MGSDCKLALKNNLFGHGTSGVVTYFSQNGVHHLQDHCLQTEVGRGQDNCGNTDFKAYKDDASL